jgi:hypothetical protein
MKQEQLVLGEEYTAGVLQGIPIFCINRLYNVHNETVSLLCTRYVFKFDNGFGASIVDFKDKMFSGGADYELAVIECMPNGKHKITYETEVCEDIERGDAKYMHELLTKIEALRMLTVSRLQLKG